jgi:general secretion pathway protein D
MLKPVPLSLPLSLRLSKNRTLALALSALFSITIAAQTPVTLNFVDADIDVVARAVGEMTGKTFVLDQRVKGKINIQSTKGVAPGLAYPTFLSALRMAGFAAVETGGVVRIVPEVDAKTLPTPVGAGLGGSGSGAITTKVIPIANQPAAQVINAIRPLVAAANGLVVYPPGNAIIITDYSDNIRRIETVIARLDTPSMAAPEIIALNHANALDVAAVIGRVFADNPAGGVPVESRDRLFVTADTRSNSVIVRSEDANRLLRVKNFVQEMDRPTSAPGNIRIVYLKHADAAMVAQTLRSVLGVDGGNSANGARSNNNTNSNSNAQSNPLASLLPGASTAGSGIAGAISAATGGAASSAAPSGNLPQLSTNNQTAFSAGGATVYADTSINALVISAPTGTYNNLRAVIEQLDVRRAQVFIEALIVEVLADKAAEFGIQWQALDGLNKSSVQGFGGTNFGAQNGGSNILGISANPTSAGQGLNLGLIRGAFTYKGQTIANLGLLARALQADSTANVLSMPTLLTLDNEEARFSGGQNVPFLTGQYAQTGSGGNNSVTPFQTIERRDVGLTLKVKPLITEGGAIRLQLYQEVSNVIADATAASAGLSSVNKRVLESTVLADTGQIVVLGGLLQEGFTSGEDKVPVLGDAPFFGNLFRYDKRKRTKTNLMIFLRPTVLRDASQLDALSNERYRALGVEQQSINPESRFMLPEMKNPGMPLTPSSPAPSLPAPAAPASSQK